MISSSVSRVARSIVICVCLGFGLCARAATPTTSATLPVPTDEQINRIAAMLPAKATGMGEPITNRQAWATAATQPWFQKQLINAKTYANQPIPDDLTPFWDFQKTGRRDTYEKPFRARTTRLVAFVVSECIKDDGQYLPLIEAELKAILGEQTWSGPSFATTEHQYGGMIGSIDLAAAARAWTVATVDFWLGDKLQADTRTAIRAQLKSRVFDTYSSGVRNGKVLWWWESGLSNWNAVCTSGVMGAALTMIESPKERALYVQAALNSMPYYISGLKDDGYCEEGIGYWNYGFGSYLSIAETLYQQTRGQLNLYQFDNQCEKLRRVALFLPHIQIIPGVFPAFGDAYPRARSMPVSYMALINQRWGMGWDSSDPQYDPHKSDMAVDHPLGDRLFNAGIFGFPIPTFGSTPIAGSPAPSVSTASPGDDESKRFFFRDGNVLICRSLLPGKRPFGLALKGGHNGGGHGHNDNGTYVVAVDRVPLVLDPGMEEYTMNSFGKHRYESMMMNSYGHDVPYVGKTLQQGGEESKGEIISTEFTDAQDMLKMDLTSGYPVPGMVKLIRTYIFHRDVPSLEVIDDADFTTPTDFGSALVTLSNWQDHGAGNYTVFEGKSALKATTTVEGDGGEIVDKVEPITGFRLMANMHPMRLGMNMSQPAKHVTMRTVYTPTDAPATEPAK